MSSINQRLFRSYTNLKNSLIDIAIFFISISCCYTNFFYMTWLFITAFHLKLSNLKNSVSFHGDYDSYNADGAITMDNMICNNDNENNVKNFDSNN